MRYVRYCLTAVLITGLLHGREGEEPHCDEGNFALPPSQQLGPLVSFGQNIIDQNQVQLFLFGDAYIGKNKHYVDLIPSILYGVTNDLSLFLSIPIAPSYKVGRANSSGIEDLALQLEYAVYTGKGSCFSDQVTVVVNASFPTGSSRKAPPTGFGAVAYFVGTTYNRTWTNWYCFTSSGIDLPMSHHGSRSGWLFLYQFGVGRNIANTQGWIFNWLVELDGTFFARDQVDGQVNPNSGGNVLYVTPSLGASSKHWIFQLGLGYAVLQHLFGNQQRERFLLAFEFVRTF